MHVKPDSIDSEPVVGSSAIANRDVDSGYAKRCLKNHIFGTIVIMLSNDSAFLRKSFRTRNGDRGRIAPEMRRKERMGSGMRFRTIETQNYVLWGAC